MLTSNSAFLIMEWAPVRRRILNSILCVAGNIASKLKKSGITWSMYTIVNAPPKRLIPQLIAAPTLSFSVVRMLAGKRRLAIQTSRDENSMRAPKRAPSRFSASSPCSNP